MRWVSPLASWKNPVCGWTLMPIFATLFATLSLQLLLLVSWRVCWVTRVKVAGWIPPIHQNSIVSITVPSIESHFAVWKSNVPFAGQCCERLFNSPVEVLGIWRVLVYGFVGVWKKSTFCRRRGRNHPYLGSKGSSTANCLTILRVSWSVWVGNLWSRFTSLQQTQQTLSGGKEPPKSLWICPWGIAYETLRACFVSAVVPWWHQQYKADQKEPKLLKHPGSQSNFNMGSLLTFILQTHGATRERKRSLWL